MRANRFSDWQIIAEKIVRYLSPGTILALNGPLGVGKTTLVQAIAKELGSVSEPKSPTFALLRIHQIKPNSQGVLRLVHVDAYRIEDERDLLPLDLEAELTEPGTVLAIEWSERIPRWMARQKKVIPITISMVDSERTIEMPSLS